MNAVKGIALIWDLFFSVLALTASMVAIVGIRRIEKKLSMQMRATNEESAAKNEREGRLNECKTGIAELEAELAKWRSGGHNL